MASKWADYVITGVRFNARGTHIEDVQVREDNGETITEPTTKTRRTVVSQIEAGRSYCTATKGSDRKWHYGAAVKVVTIDGERFIKTKSDTSQQDNLDNLPTF